MKSYIIFDVAVFLPSHGLVSPYFTYPKVESAQIGGIDHESNLRSAFYWEIGTRVDIE